MGWINRSNLQRKTEEEFGCIGSLLIQIFAGLIVMTIVYFLAYLFGAT